MGSIPQPPLAGTLDLHGRPTPSPLPLEPPPVTPTPYDKATEVWFLLHKAEQLVINDKAYHPNVLQMLNNCMDIVETLQHDIEASGN
jgi:hypothetical protein